MDVEVIISLLGDSGWHIVGDELIIDDPNLEYPTEEEMLDERTRLDQEASLEEATAIRQSMIDQGNVLRINHDDRVLVAANPLIVDETEHNTWMRNLYDDSDNDIVNLRKPPSSERQKLAILDEDRDDFTFTRYQDTWGHRWALTLHREDVNALAIAIYNKDGGYLYTTGSLIPVMDPDTGKASWYTECPAGQADPVPEDVYFMWLLGSANISDLDVYSGVANKKTGFVRSDERYD